MFCCTAARVEHALNSLHGWLHKYHEQAPPPGSPTCRACQLTVWLRVVLCVLQDLRDRTYYLSNGVIRVGGRRVATNAASFTKGDIVGVVLDADQGEIVFLRNGIEQGRARGIRGRLYPFVSFDSEQDQITLLGRCHGWIWRAGWAASPLLLLCGSHPNLKLQAPSLTSDVLCGCEYRFLYPAPQPDAAHTGGHGVGHSWPQPRC